MKSLVLALMVSVSYSNDCLRTLKQVKKYSLLFINTQSRYHKNKILKYTDKAQISCVCYPEAMDVTREFSNNIRTIKD